jgi:hypothetical protein
LITRHFSRLEISQNQAQIDEIITALIGSRSSDCQVELLGILANVGAAVQPDDEFSHAIEKKAIGIMGVVGKTLLTVSKTTENDDCSALSADDDLLLEALRLISAICSSEIATKACVERISARNLTECLIRLLNVREADDDIIEATLNALTRLVHGTRGAVQYFAEIVNENDRNRVIEKIVTLASLDKVSYVRSAATLLSNALSSSLDIDSKEGANVMEFVTGAQFALHNAAWLTEVPPLKETKASD